MLSAKMHVALADAVPMQDFPCSAAAFGHLDATACCHAPPGLSQLLGADFPLVFPGVAASEPTEEALVGAVASLYLDEVKPYGRILRKRLIERWETQSTARRLDIALHQLRAMCEACIELSVEDCGGAGEEWAVLLRGCPKNFVDVHSAQDDYPEELWREMTKYFSNLDHSVRLSGGRLACAQQLVREKLRFIKGYSLGRVCHILQLAITHRRILGYSRGKLVPYARSDQKVKEGGLEPKPPSERTSSEMEFVTWDRLRECLSCLFQTAPSADRHIPLSNVKRLFRSQFQLELDEAALGCVKLSGIFMHSSLQGFCVLERTKAGLAILPAADALPTLLGAAQRPLSMKDAETAVGQEADLSAAKKRLANRMRGRARDAEWEHRDDGENGCSVPPGVAVAASRYGACADSGGALRLRSPRRVEISGDLADVAMFFTPLSPLRVVGMQVASF